VNPGDISGDEEVDILLYAAVRAGLLIVRVTNAGEAYYEPTETGKVRARVLAPYWGADPDTLDEAQMVALAAELGTSPEQMQ
jgi:hypothetical protein